MKRRVFRVPSLGAAIAALAVGILLAGLLLERLTPDGPATARVDSPVETAGTAGDPDFDGLFRAGVARLREGQPHAAVKAFEEARQRQPHVPEVHVNLGFAYAALGVPDAARQAFERAIDLRPEQANAYFGLAEASERLGDLETALGAMRSYIHLTPEDDPYRRRAMAAVWEWQSALELGGTRPGATESPPETAAPALAGANLAGLRLTRLDGGTDSLALYAGKTLILNVWATWCAPCREELPALQRLSARLDPDQFVVAGLSIDTDADFVREFLRDVGVDYANYIDATHDVARPLFGIDSVPQTLVIGPDGTLRTRIEGLRDWDDPQLIASLGGPE